MRPAFRALRKVLRFQVYLPVLRNEGRTSLCRPERQFPNKKRRRKASAVLSERQLWINHGCQSCCVQRGELLLLSPVLPACPYMPLSGVKSFGDVREGGCHRVGGSSHLQISPSLMLPCQQQLCRAARRLSSASPPSLLPPLPLLQLYCNLGTEM